MTNHRALTVLYGVLVLIATSVVSARLERLSSLPVIFFHGITGNRHNGDRYVANLTAEGRTAIALSFCEDACSTQSLREQVPLAIQQVRDIVRHDSAFKNGYIFIGHSQGGQLSRSVIEFMDDHKVRLYISVAGIQNGIFYGPQDAALAASNSAFNDRITSGMFNFSSYPSTDYMNGQVQYDLHKHLLLNPQLHYQYAMANHARTPVHAAWAASNPHLPLVNNVNPCAVHDDACEKDKARRKANFLKLPAAHFFGSPDDGIVTPWQSSLLGQNSEVDALDDIVSGFQDFTIVNMTATREYVNDTYGLQTLDKRGGLSLHEVPSVTHACWIYDDAGCEFQTVYDRYIYPLLH